MKLCITMITLLVPLILSCSHQEQKTEVAPPLADVHSAYEAARRLELEPRDAEEFPDLHNVFRLSDNIISGSEPHGEKAFAWIAALGVKTILTVDGKKPDAEVAKKFGMRYVHVPIQYKGITEDEMLRIAKTFREVESPFFVHCFHGKHRGPTAAAVGRLILDGASREQALAEMRQWCGTSAKYEGLYGALASSMIPHAAETEALDWDFPETRPFTGFREMMIDISRSYDHLLNLSKRSWEGDPRHPDVDALNEARKLFEFFEQGQDLDEVQAEPEDFRRWLDESAVVSEELRDTLEQRRSAVEQGTVSTDEELQEIFDSVSSLCSRCHYVYRNE